MSDNPKTSSKTRKKSLPLVYSCSGCSNVAQLANDAALELDRRKMAQMSCIAGVGGNVPGLVKLAQAGRSIIALDGCVLHCVKHCLQNHQIQPDIHLTITEMGYTKRAGQRFETPAVDDLLNRLAPEIQKLTPDVNNEQP